MSLHQVDFVGDQNLPFAGGMTMKEFLASRSSQHLLLLLAKTLLTTHLLLVLA
jgi:hypothetical protein